MLWAGLRATLAIHGAWQWGQFRSRTYAALPHVVFGIGMVCRADQFTKVALLLWTHGYKETVVWIAAERSPKAIARCWHKHSGENPQAFR